MTSELNSAPLFLSMLMLLLFLLFLAFQKKLFPSDPDDDNDNCNAKHCRCCSSCVSRHHHRHGRHHFRCQHKCPHVQQYEQEQRRRKQRKWRSRVDKALQGLYAAQMQGNGNGGGGGVWFGNVDGWRRWCWRGRDRDGYGYGDRYGGDGYGDGYGYGYRSRFHRNRAAEEDLWRFGQYYLEKAHWEKEQQRRTRLLKQWQWDQRAEHRRAEDEMKRYWREERARLMPADGIATARRYRLK